jgi:prefoldin subunit 5
MEFYMALENLNAAAADLSAKADELISRAGSNEAALKQAQSDLEAVDAEATTLIQPILDKVNAALNPPA